MQSLRTRVQAAKGSTASLVFCRTSTPCIVRHGQSSPASLCSATSAFAPPALSDAALKASTTSAPASEPSTATSVGSVAYELVKGALIRYSTGPALAAAPTCVLLHGILGSRRNMQSFAKMIVEGFPSWQVLLVDLRCHGDSATLAGRAVGPHTVDAAADDVLALLRQLKIFPHTLIGHSFGGKVVMSMVKQFGQRMPRPVQVWVLDALPGQVRTGLDDGRDHPGRLIEALRAMPTPVESRSAAADVLTDAGFSPHIARWATTNLRPEVGAANNGRSPVNWTFDLAGISQLYWSYESTSLWPLLQAPPQGLKLDFVRAEGSSYRWGGEDQARIVAAGHRVHVLRNSGHWVHTDNPMGLFDILAPSFGRVDLHLQRPTGGSARPHMESLDSTD